MKPTDGCATQAQLDQLLAFADDTHCSQPGMSIADQIALHDSEQSVFALADAFNMQLRDHAVTNAEHVDGMFFVLELLGYPRELWPLFAMQLETAWADYQRKVAA